MKHKRIFRVFQERTQFGFPGVEPTYGKWRWHCSATNGRKTATSGENFDSRSNAIRAVKREMSLMQPGMAVLEIG